MNSYDDLKTKRTAFNTFNEETARFAHGLSPEEEAELGFVAIAKRIADPSVRRKYCGLAVAMLQANIKHYRSEATAQKMPLGSPSWVVASTLVASAIAYGFKGPVAALIAAAVWYWLARETVNQSKTEKTKELEEHNKHAPEWKKTIDEWQEELNELESIL
jgi:hypothetical protein